MPSDNPRKTVLIVDDSPAILEALSKVFRAAGWEVAVAEDGEEVFRKFTAYNPDSLLLDVVMPKINGAEVCRLIKGHPVWKHASLVVMSSTISDKDADAYRTIGADGVLRKPFPPQQAVDLLEKIRGSRTQAASGRSPP